MEVITFNFVTLKQVTKLYLGSGLVYDKDVSCHPFSLQHFVVLQKLELPTSELTESKIPLEKNITLKEESINKKC